MVALVIRSAAQCGYLGWLLSDVVPGVRLAAIPVPQIAFQAFLRSTIFAAVSCRRGVRLASGAGGRRGGCWQSSLGCGFEAWGSGHIK